LAGHCLSQAVAHRGEKCGVGRKGMPRSAATIFGLVLVASSIGFNTWRYPVVWRMAGSPAASADSGDSSQPSAAQPARALSAEPERAALPPTLATQGEMRPEPNAANPTAAPSPPLGANPPSGAELAAVDHRLPTTTGQEKPLAPVPRVVAFEKSVGAAADIAVRRLPPVDPNVPSPPIRHVSENPGGAIPIYPSTGIE
jgi:hypothetical protein